MFHQSRLSAVPDGRHAADIASRYTIMCNHPNECPLDPVMLLLASRETALESSSAGRASRIVPPLGIHQPMENISVGVGRIFVALRKAGGSCRNGPVFHAVTPYCRIALCCAEPGAKSMWAEPPADGVTCPACLQRLARLERST
jgi:hypothetical protein